MLEILYIDRQVVAAVKPAGIPTQESVGHETDFTSLVINYIAQTESREKVFLHPIHRLDTPTSGIVLFARSSKSLSRLQEALRNHKIKKEYIAEVEGHLKQEKGTLTDYLFHGSHQSQVVAKDAKEAKLAILNYEVLEKKEKTSLVRVHLETGRYHQIRCQFAHLGHPIVGDAKYGSAIAAPRIHLHHAKVTFTHPIEQKEMTVESHPDFGNSSMCISPFLPK